MLMMMKPPAIRARTTQKTMKRHQVSWRSRFSRSCSAGVCCFFTHARQVTCVVVLVVHVGGPEAGHRHPVGNDVDAGEDFLDALLRCRLRAVGGVR